MSRPTLTASESFVRPDAWGQVYWAQMHLSSFFAFANPDAPTDDERKLLNLYYRYILPAMLPCAGCRSEYIEWIETKADNGRDRLSIMLDNRDNLIIGLYMLHEDVNKRLGKKGITIEKFFRMYEHLKSQYCAMDTPQFDKRACTRHLSKKFYVKEGQTGSARKIRTSMSAAIKDGDTYKNHKGSHFQFKQWQRANLKEQAGLMRNLLMAMK